ncbi:glycosyltransferase, partial [Peribacillus sp. NPDC056705]
MYTRERRGVFRAAEGFDTVARSPGLEPSFIKKVLHPFCQYEAPAELIARSEKEAEVYPSALHLFHTDAGETVLGRSVFQPADFTGLRSAFFTHHYV